MSNQERYEQFLLAPLFLKPLGYPGGILFSRYIPLLKKNISFRSFDMDTDLEMVHDWVNRAYAKKYWQLDGTIEKVYDTYYNIQRNSNAHSYIGLLGNVPVCQFDLYRVLADEIRKWVLNAGAHDCGLHLIMAPIPKPVHGLSTILIQAMLEYYFSFPEAMHMYAEPDITNRRSNFLLRQANFQFIQSIELSYKTANLYCLKREQFQSSRKDVFNSPALCK